MKTITIPIPDNLDDETIGRATEVLRKWASPEWLMLLKFYQATKYEVYSKGDTITVKATVWK